MVTFVNAKVPYDIRRNVSADNVYAVALSEPADWATESAAERRRRRLARLVAEADEQEGATRVSDLAVALSVSERTIKRDLAELRAMGVELRTRRST